MRVIKFSLIVVVLIASFIACSKNRPGDEDGLLITFRKECIVTNFELLGTDYQTVRAAVAVIDTVAQTVNVQVAFGTDLKNVYPQFTLATDCKLDPKITGRTDLSDFNNPKVFTVISGDRNIRKQYKLFIKF